VGIGNERLRADGLQVVDVTGRRASTQLSGIVVRAMQTLLCWRIEFDLAYLYAADLQANAISSSGRVSRPWLSTNVG
jgi:hypothetical protein